MDVWGPARVSGQGRKHYFLLVLDDFTQYTTIFQLHIKGQEFCRGEGILHSFTLLDSPQQNGIAERRIGLVMEVAHTSMIHAAAPHFLWLFAVRYAAHQLNLWPRVSLPETSPTLRWTRKVGDASVFRVWGSRAFVHDTFADKLSAHAILCVFLGFSPDAPGWRFYHPTSRRVFPSQDVTFDESVPFYRLFPFRSAPPPSPPLFLAPSPPPVDPLPPQGPTPSGVSQVDPLPGTAPVEVAVGSGAAPRAASGGAEHGGAEPEGAGSGGAEPEGAESEGAGGTASSGGGVSTARDTGAGGAGVPARAGRTGAAGPGGARTGGTGAAGTGGVGGARAGDPTEPGAAGAGGASAVGAGAGGTGAGVRPRPYFVPLLQQVLGVPSSPEQSQPPLQPASPLPAPSPYTEKKGGPTERREPASHPASPIRTGRLHFAAACRLNYATALVAESESASPPSVGGECARDMDVLKDTQEDFECLAAAVPRFASMLLALKGDPDAPDIPNPRSYTEAITGPYSSQWQAAMDAKMASRKSTGTYVDAVPPSRANIVDGTWIFRVKRPPGSPPAFKARYVARGISTQWSLRRPVHSLRQAPREWHNTLRTTLAALGFTPFTADPSLFLRTDTSLPPFYVLVCVDNFVFATADTEALTLVLQRFGFQFSSPQPTPQSTGQSLSAPPSDESVEPSGPDPELVGCLMYLMKCTRLDLAYPISHLARYVAPGRHRKVHWDAAKRVLRYLCSTSGMGLMLGGGGPVLLTSHADTSWVDDSATQRLSQGYTFSLRFGSVSWRSTRSCSILCSSCEAKIYAGAMAAQELRWLTYPLTDLGEQPRLPPVLYVDNKAMIALC
ncbi:unnamed protein product [Closterium sp. NIES-54]